MKLQKIDHKRAFQLVEEQLEEVILSGKLKPGDKLPPEREMLADLATSRRSLREAMRVLEQKGLIETKVGVKGGSFVKMPTTDSLTKSLALLIQLKKVPVSELAEFRLDIEGAIARRAAERADERDIENLKIIAENAEKILAGPDAEFKDYKEIDREYHLALAAAARNQLYGAVLRIVHDNMANYFEKHLDYHRSRFSDHYKEMIEMLEALKNRDGDKAFALANHHIKEFFRYVEADNHTTG